MKVFISIIAFVVLAVPLSRAQFQENPAAVLDSKDGKVAAPQQGKLYHGIHIGGGDGEEDIIFTKPKTIDDYI